MLFNSEYFIFLFLPLVIGLVFLFKRWRLSKTAALWLVLASAFFYGFARIDYLLLLTALLIVNYFFGEMLLKHSFKSGKVLFLWLGILVNLGVLCYFKYSNFVLSNLNYLWGTNYFLENIMLPIGISFFTFQKIAYLVDSYHGIRDKSSALDYSLFVMFFPQLIAGPIVRYNELTRQFNQPRFLSFDLNDVSGGILLFTMGIFKKVVVGDQLGIWVDAAFQAASQGTALNFLEALGATLGFTFQLYFDFSGYTDMALGIGLIMGIQLPWNFDSPYKATSIIDYWRRWHITLSRFLKDYVYIPLGGNRKGITRQYINILLTLLIGGLWHGAAWTFIFWGFLNGIFVMVNHAWIQLSKSMSLKPMLPDRIRRVISILLIFILVALTRVFYRSQTFGDALFVLKGLFGQHGFVFDASKLQYCFGYYQFLLISICFLLVWAFPNSQQIYQKWLLIASNWNMSSENSLSLPSPGYLGKNKKLIHYTLPLAAGAIVGLIIFSIVFIQTLRSGALMNFIYFQF